jgi:Gram-negative bacterial TonB protein C-terminal
MNSGFLRWLIILLVLLLFPSLIPIAGAQTVRNGGDFSNTTQPIEKVPSGVILVKGAWSSASDSVTPVPEDGSVSNGVFTDRYFGMTYPLTKDWTQKYKGPPPSDSGRYVLAQIEPAETYKGQSRGSILITADDMFFTSLPASNALQLIDYSKDNLQADHQLELPPTQTKIAGHPFMFYAYWSPVAELHWYVLATEIRCHTVQMILSSRDTKLLQSLVLDMKSMQLPEEASPTAGNGGGEVPVCIKDYATDQHLIARADPVFTEHRFNAVPVRIIIDKDGRIKHIHYLSAFPDQVKAISDAFKKWQFKPYRKNGRPVEVETGIMFGRSAHSTTSARKAAAID